MRDPLRSAAEQRLVDGDRDGDVLAGNAFSAP